MLEQAIRTYLLSKPAIAAIVGNRVHVGDFVPTSADQLPAIGIEALDFKRDNNLDGVAWALQFPPFELVAKAQTYQASESLMSLVAKALRAIPFGATIFTQPGTVIIQNGQAQIIGVQTNWGASLNGHPVQLRDGSGNLVYTGNFVTVTSATSATVTPAPAATANNLLWDDSSASLAVEMKQVDILGEWNDDEEDTGHGLTVKPRVMRIRVGWMEDVSTI